MNTNILKLDDSESLNPVTVSEWAIDNLVSKTTPHLQSLLYIDTLSPEQTESLYKTKLYILVTYSTIHNVSLLYGEDDRFSNIKTSCYNLEHFLTASTKQILKMFDSQNICIELDIDKNYKSAFLDIRRVSFIIFNLISNSIIHTKVKEKHIKLSTSMRGDDLIITVSDNGQGISKDIQSTLFLPPKKFSSSMINETGGGLILSGMGLAVSKKLAADMVSRLTFIPTKRGATFELSIPQNLSRKSTIHEALDYEIDKEILEEIFASSLLYYLYNENK